MAKNDDAIKSLMAKVATQKQTLGSKPKVSWKTNGIFKFNSDVHLNLNTVRDPIMLVDALALLLGMSKNRLEAGKALGVDVPDFSFNGYDISEWVDDFKTRIAVITWEAKKSALDLTEAKLAALVSEEARTEMELEKIAKSLE